MCLTLVYRSGQRGINQSGLGSTKHPTRPVLDVCCLAASIRVNEDRTWVLKARFSQPDRRIVIDDEVGVHIKMGDFMAKCCRSVIVLPEPYAIVRVDAH